ncbi:hypothetical protein K4F52_005049 [Lecanicillium sp. MT-2017a]|nr:hypothetical protein K4F52_005049 [Lecanicillium sp. MT-2017a]
MFSALALLQLASAAAAQFVNQEYYRNLTVIESPGGHNVTVSYKEPTGACTTAFDTQKQYTGWVSLPGDYPANLFFWFVEAREKTDSFTVWLNGGPGSSSMYGMFGGNGPCYVVEKGLDEYETVARDWGWDRSSNMIFVDQPSQVGFSFDEPTNVTVDFSRRNGISEPFNDPQPEFAWQYQNGTLSTQFFNQTTNTTQQSAIGVWHLLQGFLGAFPEYQPSESSEMGVSLFCESYGGRYGPIFADLWEEQNAKRLSGEINANTTLPVRLESLGIVNGCIDLEIEVPISPVFASKNTYGFKAISDQEATFYRDKFNAQYGCKEKLERCRRLVESDDPDGTGNVIDVNIACRSAGAACNEIQAAYYSANRSPYDLAAPYEDPTPPSTFLEYLNRDEVIAAIGSPVNYTKASETVFEAFYDTGDMARRGVIPKLAKLLDSGIRIGMMYGDRDYICNWMGGEAVSLSVASQAGGEYPTKFPAAGYAPIIVNSSYIGGVVRQFANFSFSRIYQAGHSVPTYQPETAFQVFARIIKGASVSTGQEVELDSFGTDGPANATHTAELPSMPDTTCYIRDIGSTCDQKAIDMLNKEEGVIINGVLYSSSADWPLMNETGTPTKTPQSTSTATLTGMFTATDTPDAASLLTPKIQAALLPPVAVMVWLNLA